MKFYVSLFTCLVCVASAAQPRYDMNRIKGERLDRGVVAIRQDAQHVAVSWRTLRSDKVGEPFDVYRNGVKLNSEPLTTGGTFYIDEHPLTTNTEYEIRGGGIDGKYILNADAPVGYLPVALDKPEGGETPDGRSYTYSANDCSVGDMDGDGMFEIIVKWEPSNAHDNSHDGFTGPTLFDCYRLDGTRLWRIDMGRNIRSGAHYVPFIVFDLDGDGRCEFVVKTADGTVDGKGKAIGNKDADWREGVKEAVASRDKVREQDEKNGRGARGQRRWHRNSGPANAGRILTGKEYLTVFNGLTGEAMATTDYIPERGDVRAWGDGRGNRSERYLAGVGYFSGEKASAVFCRGYYTRTVIAAFDWDGKTLTNRWTFDTNDKKWSSYAGQGNHNLRIADVDGDGKDEITYGSMAVDDDGTGLYNTGFGHGDAIHLTVFDSNGDKLQVWDCHENKRDGSDFRDAATGKVIFQIKSPIDVGRCMAADIDPTNPGLEMWSSDSHGIRNIKGEVVAPRNNIIDELDNSDNEDNTALFIRGMRLPTNFGIWWDGDLLREMLDHETVSKYDWQTGRMNEIVKFDGVKFNNGTKSNPCLSGDILGDWREEVIARDRDSRELRIYITTIPTDYRINSLMEDIPYRISIATENVGYNQPPETGFYLGPDRTEYVK